MMRLPMPGRAPQPPAPAPQTAHVRAVACIGDALVLRDGRCRAVLEVAGVAVAALPEHEQEALLAAGAAGHPALQDAIALARPHEVGGGGLERHVGLTLGRDDRGVGAVEHQVGSADRVEGRLRVDPSVVQVELELVVEVR